MKRLVVAVVAFCSLLGCSSSDSTPGGTSDGGAAAAGGGGASAGGGRAGSSASAGAASMGGTVGGAGVPGTAGAVGAAGAGAGSGGASGGAGGASGALIWPNDTSKANSDTWLSQHHDEIAQLRPKLLVIDLENTANAQALVDKHIAALKEASSPHKFKDATAEPTLAYELVKIVQAPKGAGPGIDYASWNTQSFADSNLQLKDPADPTGPNLTLCQAFEKGVIHEVWCMASSDPKCGETQEQKQVYDDNNVRMPGVFRNVSNGDSLEKLGCKVTARVTDFNSGRGVGCHQHAMGHAWERCIEASAVPAMAKQGRRFLNFDLDTRVGAPFQSFYDACNSNSTQLTDCITWSSEIHAASGPSASRPFDLPDMSGGCGNAHFYPNTTGTYSYDANTPDPMVLDSCENYGLHNGPGGKDLTTRFTNAMTDTYFKNIVDDDCGGHGTMYLYQNFPGPGTKATNDDGTPMHDWWVYLFY